MSIRRSQAAAALGLSSVFLLAAPAYAVDGSAPGTDVRPTVSDTTPGCDDFEFTAGGFEPGSTVAMTAGDVPLGQVVADEDGVAAVDVTLGSDVAGRMNLTASGTGADGSAHSESVPVTASCTDVAIAQGAVASETLPFTGGDLVVPGLALGTAALAAGGGLLVASRRRAGVRS